MSDTKTQEELIIKLKEAQQDDGYISQEEMTEISKDMDVSPSSVYGVATFYSFLSAKPRGRNIIRICQSLPCHLKDYETVAGAIEKELGIKPGETTSDGRFTFEITNCIGACDMAPAMLVNSNVHGNLTPEKISGILKEYK